MCAPFSPCPVPVHPALTRPERARCPGFRDLPGAKAIHIRPQPPRLADAIPTTPLRSQAFLTHQGLDLLSRLLALDPARCEQPPFPPIRCRLLTASPCSWRWIGTVVHRQPHFRGGGSEAPLVRRGASPKGVCATTHSSGVELGAYDAAVARSAACVVHAYGSGRGALLADGGVAPAA